MDRHEQTEATRIDSVDNHRVADLGDLTQLSRGQERHVGSVTENAMEAVTKAVNGFADRISNLTHTPEYRAILATINEEAAKGEPLYILLKQALDKGGN